MVIFLLAVQRYGILGKSIEGCPTIRCDSIVKEATSYHKYRMRPLEHILDIDQFTNLMGEGKKAPHSSGWNDCLLKVKEQILQDHKTTKDNLREKVRNYALNYLAVTPEANGIDKDKLIGELADKIEDDLKDYSFFQQPQAALIAQRERGKIPEDPEEKFIKLCP